uniref:Fe2OG dioxygenase domain-containing protein n=1 Tax=viral metagenome TaxID=1070528 RepID=A0A6C0HAA9_9ZZZZ
MYGLDRYIYINENSLSKELCDEIINKFEEQEENKGPGSTFGGIQPKVKDTTDYNIKENNPKWSRIRETLIVELINNIQIYGSKLDRPMYHSQPADINDVNRFPKKYIFKELNVNELFFEVIMIQKYKSNTGRYIYHNDFSSESEKNRFRVLTYIYYLNDVEEGGETQFWDNYKIKPQKGKLVLFPASWTYPHSGLMPISHDKYIITGWIYQEAH